jgi:uncharacterized protein YjgD (DUF1641 family)
MDSKMDNSIQIQINELHQKMDILLEYVNKQRLNSEVIEDLIADVSIIGKDVYDSTVEELENREVEIHPAQLTELGISFLRNIQNFNVMIGTFESMMDLSKEIAPIANEMIIDFQKKLAEFEAKGYFIFLEKVFKILDKTISSIDPKSLDEFAENMPAFIALFGRIKWPAVVQMGEKLAANIEQLDFKNPPQYSLLKVAREMNSPEMKRNMGLLISLSKGLGKA